MINFNEFSRKDVTYDNIKSHKKPGFYPLFKLQKGGFNWPPLSLIPLAVWGSILLLSLNRQITSYSIILLNSIKLLNSIISKHYNTLFALILNCQDNYTTIIMALSIFILFDDWGLCFCFNVPWRNQSIDLNCESFVWILFGAWYRKEYCNFHWSFMSLFDRIFFVSTFFVLNLLLYFCSGVCSIIPFQRCQLILCNIEGQSEFSTIANSSIDGNIKKNVWTNISSDVFIHWILFSTL